MHREKISIPKLKTIFRPTIIDLKAFAMRFSKEQWLKLCDNKNFMDNIMEDLDAAAIEALKIIKLNK